jgi:hypothetical protein
VLPDFRVVTIVRINPDFRHPAFDARQQTSTAQPDVPFEHRDVVPAPLDCAVTTQALTSHNSGGC